jgi:ribonucleotide reductase alpha subunit
MKIAIKINSIEHLVSSGLLRDLYNFYRLSCSMSHEKSKMFFIALQKEYIASRLINLETFESYIKGYLKAETDRSYPDRRTKKFKRSKFFLSRIQINVCIFQNY